MLQPILGSEVCCEVKAQNEPQPKSTAATHPGIGGALRGPLGACNRQESISLFLE